MENSEALVVDLQPDACSIYSFWDEYIKRYTDIAAVWVGDSLEYRSPLNSTGRNIRNKARRKGYYCRLLSLEERNGLLDSIHEINISKEIRQGRPMSAGYTEYPKAYSTDYSCKKHYGQWIGCFDSGGKMVGYIVAQVCGSLCASSMVMGHGDYLGDGIMYLLYDYFMEFAHGDGCDVIVYSRWSDGGDGLRAFKHNIGMAAYSICLFK